MARYSLTPAAREDLLEIAQYIRDHGSAAASERVGINLRREIQKLADSPTLGHLRLDLTDEPVRFWRVYSYLIVYDPNTTPLRIIRILHAARDIEAILRLPTE